MNPMNTQDMQQHVRILGWLLILSHAIFLVIGAFVSALLISVGIVSGDSEAMPILTIVGLGVGVLMTVLGLPGMLAGYGLLKGRNWGRLLALVVAVLGLVNFPLGTAIGLYALWVLMQPAADAYFTAAHSPIAA